MKRIILLIVVLFLNFDRAVCCECFGKGRISVEDFNSHDWIFVGTLIKETRSGSGEDGCRRTGFYKIVRAYKGVFTGDTALVCDAEDIGACGLGHLTIGRDYLIFAIGDDKKGGTSACDRTTRVPIQFWPRDSMLINKQKALTSFGRIYDTSHTNFYADTSFLNKHVLKVSNNHVQRFYDDNGIISAEGKYENGLPEGLWNYYLDGRVVSKGKYIKGKKDSLWFESFSKEMTYIREYEKGEFTYKETFYYDGKISSKTEPVGRGEKWVDYGYHSNGNVRYVAQTNPPYRNQSKKLEKGLWDGTFKGFNKAGILLEAGTTKNGLSIEHWRYYYEDGNLRMEGDYVIGKKSGTWKIYYPSHKIKAMGKYKNDEKSEGWKYFGENGKELPPDPKLIKEDEDWFTYSGEKN